MSQKTQDQLLAEALATMPKEQLEKILNQKRAEEALAKANMNNVVTRIEGTKIIIEIDTTKKIGETSSGLEKVASAGGGILVGDITITLTAYRKGTRKPKSK